MHQTQKATSEDVALIALAGSTGLEPATSDVTGRRSNQTELTPQAGVRVCFRSRALRGLVYTEVCPARNNFFEKIFWLSGRVSGAGWRGLSLLLYSPAQDGKHIKCFPLRAELATNLTRASRPRRPSLPSLSSTSFAGVRRCAASPRAPRRGCLRLLLKLVLLLKEKREMRFASPVLLRLVQVNKLGTYDLAVVDEHSGHGGASGASGVAGATRVED